MFDTPQSSSLTTWYSGVFNIPLIAGKFTLDGVTPVQITQRTGVLYRVIHAMFNFNCETSSFNAGFVPSNPASLQLGITPRNGEFLLANKLLLGVDHPFPLNAWRKTKNDNEPLFVIPYGEVNALTPELVGLSNLYIYCRFMVETISDKDFAANFAKGCL